MKNNQYFTTDKTKMNVGKIHRYICDLSYWGRGRTIEEVERTIEHSLCFGLFEGATNEQIAFARVVTDHSFFGYIMDVIVFEEHQGKGYGKQLMTHMMEHESINRLKTLALKTKDAQKLYGKFGFKPIGGSELWMANDKVILL